MDREFVSEIAADVMVVLGKRRFFDLLDSRMCPADNRHKREYCQHTYDISKAVLTDCDFEQEEITEILEVLAFQGACCDCEVLFNVAEESCLRSEYWKSRGIEHEALRHNA